MRRVWDLAAWADYTHWQATDRRVLKRINALVDGCLREPFEGIGKPEPLKYVHPGRGRAASPTSIGWLSRRRRWPRHLAGALPPLRRRPPTTMALGACAVEVFVCQDRWQHVNTELPTRKVYSHL